MPEPEEAFKGITPADMEVIRRSLDRLDVEPSGIARAYRDRRKDLVFDNPMTMSSRCDQEALADSNLIRQALKRAAAAEIEIKRLNAIKIGLMLMLPGSFFMGLWFTLLILGALKDTKLVVLMAPACGTLSGILLIVAATTWASGRTILFRVHEFFAKGLFD